MDDPKVPAYSLTREQRTVDEELTRLDKARKKAWREVKQASEHLGVNPLDETTWSMYLRDESARSVEVIRVRYRDITRAFFVARFSVMTIKRARKL